MNAEINVPTKVVIDEVRGPTVPLTVVAAKKPGEWIIRAWRPFTAPQDLAQQIAMRCGMMDESIEWTTFTYPLPAYLVYDEPGDLGEGWGWPMGMWKFPYNGGDRRTEDGGLITDTYRGPVECLAEGLPSLQEHFGMRTP